jgi:hypothetical protein
MVALGRHRRACAVGRMDSYWQPIFKRLFAIKFLASIHHMDHERHLEQVVCQIVVKSYLSMG